MAINYEQVGWDTNKYVNPTNMNKMDNGIKAACDKVDEHDQQIETINSNLGKCIQCTTSPSGLKMFAARTTIQSAPANDYYEHVENLENFLPPNAQIIFGVANILGTLTPHTEMDGVSIVLHDNEPKTIRFRIYSHLSFSYTLQIAYICFYAET